MLRRAQLTLLLAAVVPTALMSATGIILLALDASRAVSVVVGVLVVAFCTSALTGYVLGSIFLSRGASLARVQNDFLSAVSHELRTPLTSMRMFVETLEEGRVTDPAERQRCLYLLQREMTRLEGLVDRLMELSRLEAGRHGFLRDPVNISDVVEDAVVAFHAATLGDATDVDVELETGLIIIGDQPALSQAVTNLLVNAWKYSIDPKQIALAAHTRGKSIELTVTDNGPGIPRAEQKHIFDKFERGTSAIEGGTPGSGLGLSIVKAIVKAHRGKISIRSDSRTGSRFSILLPRAAP